MPKAQPELVEFTLTDRTALTETVERLAADRDGWINLQPVPDDDEDELVERRGRAGVFALFSGRGPELPIGTWVPGEVTRKGVGADSVGLQHAGGPKVRFVLADAGVPIPNGWRLRADHPKRGLVVEPPPGTSAVEELDWLLRAAVALAPEAQRLHWVALVYRR